MTPLVAMVLSVAEPHSGITFDVPVELTCVYLPASPLAEGCDPFPEEKLAAIRAEDTFLFATDGEAVLIGGSIDVANVDLSEAELDQFVRGVAQGFGKKNVIAKPIVEPSGHLFHLAHFGGPDIAVFRLTGDQVQASGAVLAGKGELVSLLLISPQPSNALDRVISRVRVPYGLKQPTAFGESPEFRLGAAFGEVLGYLICGGGIVAIIVWAVRRKPELKA